MGVFERLASGTRAVTADKLPAYAKGARPRNSTSGIVGNQSVTYSTPGMPETPRWNAGNAIELGYYDNLYAMRGARAVADAVGSLPFRAGPSIESQKFDLKAPLAKLLGPAPGSPNPSSSSRAFWVWTIVQKIITGRYAWELEPDRLGRIVNVWPLVSAYVQPIPSGAATGPHWSGFAYMLPTGRRDLPADRVHYGWRQSQRDWWEPESPLESVSLEVNLSTLIRRYSLGLVKNGMVASKLVVHPPFDDAADEAAWQRQFIDMHVGVENAGSVVFAAVEQDIDPGTSKPQGNAGVQVFDLSQNAVDSQLMDLLDRCDGAILRAQGVPMSIVGDASKRTYENADQEHRNFWTGPVLDMVRELQDDINTSLAPRLGEEVGWFDLSGVEALRPARVFAQIAPDNALNAGLIVREDWRNDVGLAPMEGDDADKLPAIVPAEEDTPGASGAGSGGSGGGGGSRSVTAPVRAQPSRVLSTLETFADQVAELDDTELRAILDDPGLRSDPV